MTGRDLREWREGRGFSQREAAKALDVGTRTLQTAEAAPTEPLSPRLRRRLAARLSQELASQAGAPVPATEPKGPVVVPAELVEALDRADTAQELLELEKHVARESARGALDLRLAAFLVDACREMRQTLAARNEERGHARLAELEILTLDEAEDLRAIRASKTPKPLAPGEAPSLPTAPPSVAPPTGGAST